MKFKTPTTPRKWRKLLPKRTEWTISFGFDPNEPIREFHYFRKVSYFKGKRYVWHTCQRNVEYDVVRRLSNDILEEIDAQIMKDLIVALREQELQDGTKETNKTEGKST
jgi:hypothetical protein